jgi:hypothetical protein
MLSMLKITSKCVYKNNEVGLWHLSATILVNFLFWQERFPALLPVPTIMWGCVSLGNGFFTSSHIFKKIGLSEIYTYNGATTKPEPA